MTVTHHLMLYRYSGARCVEVNEHRPIKSAIKDSAGSIDVSDVYIVHKFAGLSDPLTQISRDAHAMTLNISETIRDRHMVTADH